MTMVTLKTGVKFTYRNEQNDTRCEFEKVLTLQQLQGKDIIEAQIDSEVLTQTPQGFQLLVSPTLMGLNILRRQVKSAGKMQGSLTLEQIKNLEPHDLETLQLEADKLDIALANSEALASRGRAESAGETG